jgi:hypothetical protein
MDTAEKDILELLTDETAEQVAKELTEQVAAFGAFAKLKDKTAKEKIGMVDFSFDLSKGKVASENANTWFAFDLKRDTMAFAFMKAMYARDLPEDENQKLLDFVGKVATILTEKFQDQFRDAVRKAVIPDSDPRAIPLEKVEILGIELVDYSSVDDIDKKTVKYIKLPDVPVNMRSLTSRIMEVRDEHPELTVADIIQKERLAANPVFDAIMGVQMGDKYLWDCQMAMFVDYSVSQEVLDAVKKKKV